MQSVFLTKRIEIASNRHAADFSLKVKVREFGVFSSKEIAEKHIKTCAEDFKNAKEKLLGFFVEERKLDYDVKAGNSSWYPTVEAVWSYLSDGTPFSYSPFTSDWNVKCYRGTPEDAIKFKKGDIAWMLSGSKILPVKVSEVPMTRNRWKELIEKNSKKVVFSDNSDDCYLVVLTKGHAHPQTETLFPFNETLPQNVLDALNRSEDEID